MCPYRQRSLTSPKHFHCWPYCASLNDAVFLLHALIVFIGSFVLSFKASTMLLWNDVFKWCLKLIGHPIESAIFLLLSYVYPRFPSKLIQNQRQSNKPLFTKLQQPATRNCLRLGTKRSPNSGSFFWIAFVMVLRNRGKLFLGSFT